MTRHVGAIHAGTIHAGAKPVGDIVTMAMSPGEIESLIKQAIPDAQVKIEDLRGDSIMIAGGSCISV